MTDEQVTYSPTTAWCKCCVIDSIHWQKQDLPLSHTNLFITKRNAVIQACRVVIKLQLNLKRSALGFWLVIVPHEKGNEQF